MMNIAVVNDANEIITNVPGKALTKQLTELIFQQ